MFFYFSEDTLNKKTHIKGFEEKARDSLDNSASTSFLIGGPLVPPR